MLQSCHIKNVFWLLYAELITCKGRLQYSSVSED